MSGTVSDIHRSSQSFIAPMADQRHPSQSQLIPPDLPPRRASQSDVSKHTYEELPIMLDSKRPSVSTLFTDMELAPVGASVNSAKHQQPALQALMEETSLMSSHTSASTMAPMIPSELQSALRRSVSTTTATADKPPSLLPRAPLPMPTDLPPPPPPPRRFSGLIADPSGYAVAPNTASASTSNYPANPDYAIASDLTAVSQIQNSAATPAYLEPVVQPPEYALATDRSATGGETTAKLDSSSGALAGYESELPKPEGKLKPLSEDEEAP